MEALKQQTQTLFCLVVSPMKDECCYDCIEITANNIVYLDPPTSVAEAENLLSTDFTIAEDMTIIAVNKIKFEEDLTLNIFPGVTVEFQSGEGVFIGEDLIEEDEKEILLTADLGGDLILSVENCAPGFVGDPPQALVVTENDIKNRLELRNVDATKEESKRTAILIYPNPSHSGVFNIEVKENNLDQETVLAVYDAQGNRIPLNYLLGDRSQQIIDLSAYANGLYVVMIHIGEYSEVRKIVKN